MLIVISDSDFKPGETAIVNELFRSGLDLFHIRKYGADERELLEMIDGIQPEYRSKLVLNHNHRLGSRLGVNRFHYSGIDRKAWEKDSWNGVNKSCVYSTSVHDMEEYNELPMHFSYAFLSPVFDSISKTDYKAATFDLSKRQNYESKLIGLGGIHAGNLQHAIRMGFDGVALLGAIWKSENPVIAFEKIKNEIQTSHSA